MVQRFDYLVIGSGIAGMSFALKVANEGKSVALICKAGQEEANTYFAQGGIASVTNLKVDNFEKHIEDTMIAGDWISDRAAVRKSCARPLPRSRRLSDGELISIRKKAENSICIKKEDTPSFVSCTMPTIREPRYRRA